VSLATAMSSQKKMCIHQNNDLETFLFDFFTTACAPQRKYFSSVKTTTLIHFSLVSLLTACAPKRKSLSIRATTQTHNIIVLVLV
jgi:hypothetical protein